MQNNIIPVEILMSAIREKNSRCLNQDHLDLPPHIWVEVGFLTDVPEIIHYQRANESSDTKILGHVNHPTFEATKRWLIRNKYIKEPEYSCWNGCNVSKPFFFNDQYLAEGERFYDASAWGTKFKIKK